MNVREFRENLRSQYTQEHHDSETFLVGREQWEEFAMEAYAEHKIEEAVKKIEAIIDTCDGDGMQRGVGRDQCIKILKNL